MSQKSGDQTEKPTQKKLRDAREEGNVARSEDLTKTVLIGVWLIIFWLMGWLLFARIEQLMALVMDAVRDLDSTTYRIALFQAARLFAEAIIPLVVAAALAAVAVEFLQVGPLLAFKKVQPKMSHLNPVENIKKRFAFKSLVEVAKSVVKTGALLGILLIVLLGTLNHYLDLPYGGAEDVFEAYWYSIQWIAIFLILIFFFISVLDVLFQKQYRIKELMMSRRDIRQERKDSEGDPQMKQQRKDLHKEWGQQNMLSSVRQSNVVVTNPTHIAIALYYEHDETELPVVVAKGEDYEADLIRREAERHDIPIMRDVPLARGLHADVELEDYISSEYFQAVAVILQWAEAVRQGEASRDEPPDTSEMLAPDPSRD